LFITILQQPSRINSWLTHQPALLLATIADHAGDYSIPQHNVYALLGIINAIHVNYNPGPRTNMARNSK
jgi:hypothetical protein